MNSDLVSIISEIILNQDKESYGHCGQWVVEHILVECGDFSVDRQRYSQADIYTLIQLMNVTYVFHFLREIGLFYSI